VITSRSKAYLLKVNDDLAKKCISFIPLALLVLLSLLPLWIAYHIWPYRNDDLYITLTYARNLAQGKGFVYNRGQPVLGTTTPLYAFIVAGVSRLFPFLPLDQLAVYFSALAWIGTAWGIFYGARRLGHGPWEAVYLALTLLCAPQWGIGSFGMEATLFQLLLTASIFLCLFDHPVWAGMTLGLLTLTRGEGGLVFLLLAGYELYRTRHPPWRLFLAYGMVAGMWALYAIPTFGSPLPNALQVKMIQGQLGPWNSFHSRLFREWLPAVYKPQPLFTHLLEIAFLICGIVYAAMESRYWLLWAGWGILYVGAYSILKVAGYWWYLLNILFVLQLFTALGVVGLPKLSKRIALGGEKPVQVIAVLLAVLIAGANLERSFTHASAYKGDHRGPAYVEISHWLNEHTLPQESVAFVEIGYLGYNTYNHIIDLCGLVSPEILPYFAHYKLREAFEIQKPDYYIRCDDFDWLVGTINHSRLLSTEYQAVYQVNGPYRSPLVIYAREDSHYLREEQRSTTLDR